ncbi:MAG: hydroxyacylglutathione hydrolase [Pseudomonadota bacterium]
MPIACHLYPCRSDNYGVLVRDEATGQTALIDVPEEMATRSAIEETGWTPTHIFITHHHGDHIDGVGGIRSTFDVEVIGNAADAGRLPRLTREVHPGDEVMLGETPFMVLDTPGHTVGHIAYVSAAEKLALVGDTLFALGCGRMFEGAPDQFYASLQALAALPDETQVFCGHEYAQANARFAVAMDPDNADLATHAREIDAKRAAGQPTVPTTMSVEKRFNPFLRAASVHEFTRLRQAKDNF